MDKTLKRLIWFTIPAPAIFLAIIWNRLPAIVPVHYNLHGEADRYGNKNELLLLCGLLIGVSLVMYLLVSNIYRVDPKRNAPENKLRLHRVAFSISVFLSVLNCIIIYSSYHQDIKWTMRLMLAAIGLLFTVLGNYMHTIKPNYFIGIRLPWTLENEENWRKTHMLAGKLFFSGGLLIILISFLIPIPWIFPVFTTFTVLACLIPCIYSFQLYKNQKLNRD